MAPNERAGHYRSRRHQGSVTATSVRRSKTKKKVTASRNKRWGGGPENQAYNYRGVRQRSWGSWVAEIRCPDKTRKWLGSFATAHQAAFIYNKAAEYLYGNDAELNKIDVSKLLAEQSAILQNSPLNSEGKILVIDSNMALPSPAPSVITNSPESSETNFFVNDTTVALASRDHMSFSKEECDSEDSGMAGLFPDIPPSSPTQHETGDIDLFEFVDRFFDKKVSC